MASQTSLRILVESVDGIAVVTLADAMLVDNDVLAEVGGQLDLIDGPGLSRVVINFREVRHMSSAMLRSLMTFSRRVTAHGGRLRLCGIAPELRELFKIVRFDHHFEIHEEEWIAT